MRGVPKCPANLDRVGKAAWREMSELLDAMQVMTLADGRALELLCDAYAQYRAARAVIAKDGMTYLCETQHDVIVRQRPEVIIAADAWRRTAALLIQFGLTPASRSKVTITGEESDPLEEFLNRGPGGPKRA